MTPVERVKHALAGTRPDHPPVSFWHHFSRAHGRAAVDAHLRHQETYDLDFVKVMNDNFYPHRKRIRSIEELGEIETLRGDEKPFERQLDLIRRLRQKLGPGIPMVTTVFNPLWVLRRAVVPPKSYPGPNFTAKYDGPSRLVRKWMKIDPAAIRGALEHYAVTLRAFARQCVREGADGIFFTARFDWLETTAKERGRYRALAKPSDLIVLEGASRGWFNLLHACGDVVDLAALEDYPASALNWADRTVGPSIDQAKKRIKITLCGGVDESALALERSPATLEKQVADALRKAGARSLIVAPGCAYDPDAPAANLHAVVRASRSQTTRVTSRRRP